MGSDFLLTHWYGDRPSSEVEDELVTRLVAALPATLPELIEQLGIRPWPQEVAEAKRRGLLIRGVPYLVTRARVQGYRITLSPIAPTTYKLAAERYED